MPRFTAGVSRTSIQASAIEGLHARRNERIRDLAVDTQRPWSNALNCTTFEHPSNPSGKDACRRADEDELTHEAAAGCFFRVC